LKALTIANSALEDQFYIRRALTRNVIIRLSLINGTLFATDTIAAGGWSIATSQIGRMEAAFADLEGIDITDSEIKRGLIADALTVRSTLLLNRTVIGAEIDFSNSLLTTTTIIRSEAKSDIRLEGAEARCSTKIHKSKISGDVIANQYQFSRVTIE